MKLSRLFFSAVVLFSFAVSAEETHPPVKAGFLVLLDKNHDSKVSQEEFFAALEKKFQTLDVDKSDTVSVQELKVYGEKDAEAKKKARSALKLDIPPDKTYTDEAFNQLVLAQAEQEFSALDKNHDNELSPDERAVQKKPLPKNAPAKKNKVPVKAHEHQKMRKEEFMALALESAEQRFFALDSNFDGVLTSEELGLPKPKPQLMLPAPVSETAVATTAPDKQTLARQKLVQSLFAGIDTDKDGVIGDKEKTAAFTQLFNRLDRNHDQFITPSDIVAAQQAASSAQP